MPAATAITDAPQPSMPRDPRGRFQPGHSGNPAGKKPGTLNHATRLKLLLADEAYDVVARRMIDAATEGHRPSVRFLMERLVPKPRGRAIALDLPAGASRAERVRALVDLMCAGEISAEEAKAMIRVLGEAGDAADLHSPCKSASAAPAAAAAAAPAPVPVPAPRRGDTTETSVVGDAALHSACMSRVAEPAGLRDRLLGSTAIPAPVTGARVTWAPDALRKRAA